MRFPSHNKTFIQATPRTSYAACSRYVDRDNAWSVDEDGINVEFLPLPTADITRCFGARIAELLLAAVSQ